MCTLLWNCTFFKEDKTAHFVFDCIGLLIFIYIIFYFF